MKFILGKNDAVWWPVTASMPNPDVPGGVVSTTLKALIVPQDQDEFLAAQEEISKVKGARSQAAAERAYLATRVKDWDWPDATDADQRPLACTPESLDVALRQTWFRVALWGAINDISVGQAARLGN